MTSRIVVYSLLLLFACGEPKVEEGIRVDLHVAGGSCAGCEEVYEQAHAVVESMELFACPSKVASLLRTLTPIRVAHAHGAGSPTRLEVPVAVDLMGGEPLAAGALQPPAGRYCSVEILLGPADEDAVGLPSEALVGSSLRVLRRVDQVEGAISRRASFRVSFDQPLVLDEDERRARILVTLGTGWREPLGEELDEEELAGALAGLGQGLDLQVSRPVMD